MSVMRRSLTPPSIDPPSSSSIAPSSSVLSVESSIRVPIGSTLKIAGGRVRGHRAVGVGPGQLGAGQDLDLQRDAQLRAQARRRGAAERVQRAVQPARLLGRELGRAREVDRAHAATPLRGGLLLGQPAVTRRVDERRDRIRGEDGSAALLMPPPPTACAGTRSCSTPPASRTVIRRVPTWTRIVRPRVPPVSEAITRMRAASSSSRTAASLRWPTSREAEDTVNIEAPPTSTASSIRPARAGGEHAIDELGDGMIGELERARLGVAAAGGQHDVRQPGHAEAAIHQRQADARAQAEGHEDIAGDGRGGELTHPDHRLRHCYRPNRRQQLLDAALIGDEQEGDRGVGALDDEVGVQQQRDVAGAGALGQHGLHDRAEHVGRRRGRRRLELHPGHLAERVQVRRAHDVADLHQRGVADLGAGLDAQEAAHRRPRRWA